MRSRIQRRAVAPGFVSASLIAATLLGVEVPANALTVKANFAPSITKASNAADIEAEIRSSLAFYSQFSNRETVSIRYTLMKSGLGASETTIYDTNYSDFANLLSADSLKHPGNTVLAGALAHLASGNQADLVTAPSADFRALGDTSAVGLFSGNGSFDTGGKFDGIIYLNASIMSFTGTVGSGQYGAEQVIQHETDEVLGIGGPGTDVTLPYGATLGGQSYIGDEDLYRYSAPGVPSFTASTGATAYFSIDGGATNIAAFNQSGQGDYADWAVTSCAQVQLVQDWAGCPGKYVQQFGLTTTSPEAIGLQAIGYDFTSGSASSSMLGGLQSIPQSGLNFSVGVPELQTWTLMIAGLALLGASFRRRRPRSSNLGKAAPAV